MMLAIEVELLGGCYVATEHNDRLRAEWPPHPARFFSALVAALHDREPVDPAERTALLWLEEQPPPELDVELQASEAGGRRDIHPVFVPVNDVSLVGDPEAPVRAARARLAMLEQEEQTKRTAGEVAKARREVEKRDATLAAFIADQQRVDQNPAASAMRTAAALLPDARTRQERTFPVVVPGRSTFVFLWPEAEPEDQIDALRRLCDRVTRLGHSSSLVRCTLVDRVIDPSLVPRSTGRLVLRVVGSGQLQRLEEAYERHQAVDARVLPSRPQRYDEPRAIHPEKRHSVFATDEWVVFERIGGDRPLGSRGSDLAAALRRALIETHGSEDLPSALSGHAAGGGRATQPHLAFVALPWVGHERSDGSVQGLAIISPRSLTAEDREVLLRLLARWEMERGDADDGYAVDLGTPADVDRPLRVRFRRVEVPTKAALDAARWCRSSSRFVTATPIALDRHPGNLRSNLERAAHKAATEAEESIMDACERIGLPRPIGVSISFAPLLPGGQHVRQFAPWPLKGGKARRARVHADIVFPEAVRGPVLIGAGRYFGLGLCLPTGDRGRDNAERRNS